MAKPDDVEGHGKFIEWLKERSNPDGTKPFITEVKLYDIRFYSKWMNHQLSPLIKMERTGHIDPNEVESIGELIRNMFPSVEKIDKQKIKESKEYQEELNIKDPVPCLWVIGSISDIKENGIEII